MSLLTALDSYVAKGTARLASANAVLHPATPLITADKELNPMVNGAVPDYKATAVYLARDVLQKHGDVQNVSKQLSDQYKNVMVLAGVVSSLRPVVLAIRNNPFLWAFVPKDLKRGVELVLHLQLPGVDMGSDAFGFQQAAQNTQRPA